MNDLSGKFITFNSDESSTQLDLGLEALIPSGRFITFEGGEGTGKSTQLKMLSHWLSERLINNLMTKEPGGTEIGQELRKMLLCGDKDKFDAVTEALLYYADRRIHLTNKIWPAIKKGTWVLSDRFADSTVVYQYYGYEKKVPIETLNNLYTIAVGDFKPDLTIVFDLDPKIGLERSFKKSLGMVDKETRHESRGLGFHQRVREGYLDIASKEKDRFIILDANKTIEELHIDVINVISRRYNIK